MTQTTSEARKAKLAALREEAHAKAEARRGAGETIPESLTEAVAEDIYTAPVDVETFIKRMGLEGKA